MNYKELCKRIEELETIYDEKVNEFDTMWFTGEPNNASFDEYRNELRKYTHPYGGELKKLEIIKRLTMPYTLTELPDYGDVMSLESFISACNDGLFINYDGYGNYVKDGKMSDVEIYPSDIKSNNVRTDFTEIVWFNR